MDTKENVNKKIIRFLSNRDINTNEKLVDVLEPKYTNINKLNNYQEAIDLLDKNINNESCKIISQGDYDVDGISSMSILFRTLKLLNAYDEEKNNRKFFAATRSEGYGMSVEKLDKILKEEKEFKHLFFVFMDHGINEYEQMNFLNNFVKNNNDYQIDVLILDHHMPNEDRNKMNQLENINLVIVNPNDFDNEKFENNISAGVVTYKILEEYIKQKNPEKMDLFKDKCLWFAGLSTISDVMPCLGENRLYINELLKKMNSNNEKQIDLFNPYHNNIDEKDIGWSFVPLLNSSSRMTNSSLLALEYLNSNELAITKEKFSELKGLNDNRKKITNDLGEYIIDNINNENDILTFILTKDILNQFCVSSPKGLIGLLANKVMSHYNKPTIIFSESYDSFTGSGRVPKDSDLKLNILFEKIQSLLITFGGHEKAAGLSVSNKKIGDVIFILSQIEDEKQSNSEDIFYDFDLEEYTQELHEELKTLKPFGQMFDEPKIRLSCNIDDLTIIQKGRHCYIYYFNNGNQYKIVKWNCDKSIFNKKDHVTFVLEASEFKNELQFVVNDIF